MIEAWYSLSFMGYGNYDVSNTGQVRKHTQKCTRLMKLRRTASGHTFIGLTANGVQKSYTVAKLVLEATGTPKKSPMHKYILHLDGDRTNNRLDNLRWTNKKTAIRYRRSYIRESQSKDRTTRPVIEMNSERLYKSIMDAAQIHGIPPIDILNQCRNIYSPECEALKERFSWVEWAGRE